jgi:hypothetical protein
MSTSLRTTALALGFVAFAAGPVLAVDSAPPAGALAPDAIARQLESAGYRNVHDVEFDDGHYEADATSPAGVAVDLHIDPLSGKVTHEEQD